MTKRQEVQRSAFTVHKLHNWIPLEDEADPHNALLRIRIPREARSKMREQLSRSGIDHMSHFPDLEGVATFLKQDAFGRAFKAHHWRVASPGKNPGVGSP